MNKKYFTPTAEINSWDTDVIVMSGDNLIDWESWANPGEVQS